MSRVVQIIRQRGVKGDPGAGLSAVAAGTVLANITGSSATPVAVPFANVPIPFSAIASKPTTLAGYGITDGLTAEETVDMFQPVNSNLSAISQLSTTTYGRSLLTQTNAAALRQVASVPSVDSLTINSRAELLASTEEYVQWPAEQGGEFRLSPDQVSPTDNVLRISRTDGSIVERVWNKIDFFSEWVPLNVVVETSFGPFTPIVSGDRLVAAVGIIPAGATLHLKQSTTYEIDYPLRPSQNITIDGHGATIRRGAQRASLLTANASTGTNTVTVANASVFRVGMRAFVVKTPGVLGGHAHVNGTTTFHGFPGSLITAINGNVVTLGDNLQQNCVVGNKLVALDALIINDDPATRINIIDTVFDGNNSQHSDVLDWAAGYGVALAFATIHRCVFINHPNECISIGSGSIIDCRQENSWGSFYHASNAVQANSRGTLIQNCHTRNTNTKNNGHSEGVITFSANSWNIRVRDCVFDNSGGTKGQGVFGLAEAASEGDKDQNFFFENVEATNFASILTLASSTGPSVFDRVHISNCTFDTCGQLLIQGNNITKTGFVNETTISDCVFVNCWAEFRAIRYLNLLNNHWSWNIGGDGVCAGVAPGSLFSNMPTTRIGGTSLVDGDYAGLLAADGSNPRGVYIRTGGAWVYSAAETSKFGPASLQANVFIYDCGLNWIGGSVQAPGFPGINGGMANGLLVTSFTTQRDEAGLTTLCNTKANVSDVDIIGFPYGLVTSTDASWAIPAAFDCPGWRFSNVKVHPIRSTIWTTCIGIEVYPGCVAEDCHVYLPETSLSSATTGILLKGPMDPTRNIGGVAKNCFVPYIPYSFASAIRIGITSGGTGNVMKNCVAVNNLIAKAVDQATANDKIDVNNVIVSSSTLPGMTTQTPIRYRPLGINGNLY